MAYRMTAARRAALRKAQAASARKRRGRGKGKLAAANRRATRNKRIALAAGGLAGAAALAGYGSYKKVDKKYRTQRRAYARERVRNRALGLQNRRLTGRLIRMNYTASKKKSYKRPTKRVYSERVYTPQLALPRGST